jgi:hypothetical protein
MFRCLACGRAPLPRHLTSLRHTGQRPDDERKRRFQAFSPPFLATLMPAPVAASMSACPWLLLVCLLGSERGPACGEPTAAGRTATFFLAEEDVGKGRGALVLLEQGQSPPGSRLRCAHRPAPVALGRTDRIAGAFGVGRADANQARHLPHNLWGHAARDKINQACHLVPAPHIAYCWLGDLEIPPKAPVHLWLHEAWNRGTEAQPLVEHRHRKAAAKV